MGFGIKKKNESQLYCAFPKSTYNETYKEIMFNYLDNYLEYKKKKNFTHLMVK